MTPLLTQILVKKKLAASRSLLKAEEKNISDDDKLYYKDIAGFIIFLIVIFCVLMIAMHA